MISKHPEANKKGYSLKRIGNIYHKICDIENIKIAIYKSSLGKRTQKHVLKILNNIDYYALQIKEMLISQTYIPSPYKTKKIYDGANKKERIICKPNYYPDQIIHWALILQIQPILMKGMYSYNCGSVPGRGTSYGQKIVRKWLDKDPKNTKYCLKLDISKFYPSINNRMLIQKVKNKIKDRDCISLITIILYSYNYKGLPIGSYISQWFSNFFLEDLDHYIKEELQIKHYIRYVDDMVLFSSNKKILRMTRGIIRFFLIHRNLILKNNWQVFRTVKRDIDFLGLRFYCNKTILRKRNALRIRRRISKIKKKGYLNYKDACAVISYWGWIKRSDSYNFYKNHIKPYVSIKSAKQVVSNYSQYKNRRTA